MLVRPIWCAALLALAITACGGNDPEEPRADDVSPVADDVSPPINSSLLVTLDDQGRPYDVHLGEPATAERLPLGSLAAPEGRLLVMDGNAVEVSPSFFADEAVEVTVAPDKIRGDRVHEINLELVVANVAGQDYQSTLGVWLGPTDAAVAAWDPFEYAYGTDGGVGGIIPVSVIPLAAALPGEAMWVEDPDYGARYELLDLDGIPGPETFIFSNGWGDGGFPLTRGRDEDGNVVAVVIWRTDFPWRAAFPQGVPPADVTAAEEQFIECMRGDRSVDEDGRCQLTFDEN